MEEYIYNSTNWKEYLDERIEFLEKARYCGYDRHGFEERLNELRALKTVMER